MHRKALSLVLGGVALLLLAVVTLYTAPEYAPAVLARWLPAHSLAGAPLTLAVAVDNPQPGGAGASIIRGMQLLAEDTNRSGGVHGRPLLLDIRDDAGTAEQAEAVATTLARNSTAVAVIGHRLSTASRAAGAIYAAEGLVAVSPASTAHDVTNDKGWMFRTVFTNDFAGRFLVHYLQATIAPEALFFVSGAHGYGRQLTERMQSEAQSIDLPVGGVWEVAPGATALTDESLMALIEKLRKAGDTPQVLFLALYPEEAMSVVRAIRDTAGLENVVLAGPDALDRPDFPGLFRDLPQEQRNPGYYTNGLIVASALVYDTAGRAAGFFRERYISRYGQPPDWRAALAYDAGKAVVEALRRADHTAVDAVASLATLRRTVRDGLLAMDRPDTAIEGLAGPVFFDPRGNVRRPVAIGRYQNGRLGSAFAQFQSLGILPDGARLPDLLAARQMIEVHKHLFERTQVVFAGLLLQDIQDIDLGNLSAELSGEIWFRAAEHPDMATGTAVDIADIIFLNATGPVQKEVLAQETGSGDVLYKRLRFSGTFRMDFVLDQRTYRRPMLGVEFRHRTQPANNLLYVADLVGMGVIDQVGYTQTLERLAPSLEARRWQILDGTVFQGQVRIPSLGDPRYLSQPGGTVPYSTFVAVARLGEVTSLAHLPLLLAAEPARLLLGSLAALVLLLMVEELIPRLRRCLVCVVLESGLVAVILALSQHVVIESFQDDLLFVYLLNIDRGFQAVWWLWAAWYLNIAIRRFGWEPLERRTGRAVPGILKHFVAAVVLLLAVFGILAFVYEQTLTSLLATSGLLTLIIGLAVQVNISNIFAGIILSLERPFAIGDTIRLGDMDPVRVCDMSWRTTRLEDGYGYMHCIPNSKMAESPLINYSRRKPARDFLHIHLPPDIVPAVAISLMQQALATCETIVPDNTSSVSFLGIQVLGQITAARYSVSYNVDDYFNRWPVREEVGLKIWGRLAAEGIASQIDTLRLPVTTLPVPVVSVPAAHTI